MFVLWIYAALASAAAAALIVHRSARAARTQGAEDPSVGVYRRQIDEIDDLARRGLIPEDEVRAARAEAARRLLGAADAAPHGLGPGRWGRRLALAAAFLAPLLAAGVYLKVGSPGMPDQPFVRRLAAWRKNPAMIGPQEMAAVLTQVAGERPNDPRVLYYLARAQLQAGDAVSAEQALERATQMAPGEPALWTALGETRIAEADGATSPEALAAFRRALALDPKGPATRYFIARGEISGGDAPRGVADLKALETDLQPGDPRRAQVDQDLAEVARTGTLEDAPSAAAGGGVPAEASGMIREMVARLAARLDAAPDDPPGWARLIRSYAVLGDRSAQATATARARRLFAGRPDALRQIDAAAGGAP